MYRCGKYMCLESSGWDEEEGEEEKEEEEEDEEGVEEDERRADGQLDWECL